MARADRIPATSVDGMATAGDAHHIGNLSGRALCSGNPEILFRCPKPDSAQARRSGDVDRAGRACGVGNRSGADAIVAGSHIDSFGFMLAVVVGKQSAKAVVIRCRKIFEALVPHGYFLAVMRLGRIHIFFQSGVFDF